MKIFSFVILILVTQFVTNVLADSLFSGPLINAEWLADNIDEVVILDSRKELDTFTKEGHIENAILVDANKIRINRVIDGKKLTRMRPDAKNFQQFMRLHGINHDSQIVLTHRGKTPGHVAGAARLYWHLKYYDFNNVVLLDGGNAAWVAALEDLTEETIPVTEGNYKAGKEHAEIVATMQQVQSKLNDSSTTFIDTRAFRYHIGIDKKDYVYDYGHIPGSRNLPYKFLHPAKGNALYFPKEKLIDIISALRIDMNNELILYCNSAYECSSDWFVLRELLGHKQVRIYDGSLHQWTQYENNPMTTFITK